MASGNLQTGSPGVSVVCAGGGLCACPSFIKEKSDDVATLRNFFQEGQLTLPHSARAAAATATKTRSMPPDERTPLKSTSKPGSSTDVAVSQLSTLLIRKQLRLRLQSPTLLALELGLPIVACGLLLIEPSATGAFAVLSVVLSFILPFSQLLRMLIVEKEERLREQLLMHGAR